MAKMMTEGSLTNIVGIVADIRRDVVKKLSRLTN
jgi:hypothetical protein